MMRSINICLVMFVLGMLAGWTVTTLTYVPENNTPVIIAEKSHFIGCYRIAINGDYCRELSAQYAKQVKEDLGL